MSEPFSFCLAFIRLFPGIRSNQRNRIAAVSLVAFASFAFPGARSAAQTPTPVQVPTWRYDNTRQGQNTHETALTPANVNVNTFGKLTSLAVDSTIYAQPLYIPGLLMSDGLLHNVLFVATENDSIYAYDADPKLGSAPKLLWQITLLDTAHGASAGETAIPWNQQDAIYGQGDIGPTIGITGTPVINPATNTLYVVGNTELNGAFFSRLHAINILTGAEQTGPAVQQSPVLINATVAGTGQASSGGKVSFDALLGNQRPALGFYNGTVYIGYSSHGDIGPWHGWLFAYDATTMKQSAVLCLSPNGFGASLWASGAGFPIDDDASGGRLFLVTGNGTFETNYPPFTQSLDFGESIVRLNLANGGLAVEDAFTSFNAQALNTVDNDQGSGGVLMIPDQQGSNPHILVQEGKEGRILVLNRDSLGGFASGASSNTNILQDLPGETQGTWSTPAYWNGHVYIWGSGDFQTGLSDTPKMFSLASGVLSEDPSSVGVISSQFPGASFMISSNGKSNGIAWAVRNDQFSTYGLSVLYAWDATDLTKLLYESDTNSGDSMAGTANKFALAMVTNGKAYVPSEGHVTIYGLKSGEPTAAAPTFSPNGGAISTTQTISMATTTSPAQIFYTIDGSTPTTGSTLYNGPLTIVGAATVKALAVAPGYNQSSVAGAQFDVESQAPAVSFSPAAGTFTSNQQVILSDTDAMAAIHYTADGTTPTSSSTAYTAPIAVSASETISAIAIDPSMFASAVTTAAYVITPPPMPTLALTATTPAAVAPGSATTSTLTITPGGGFTGTVVIACSVTSSPAGAVDPPTCSATQPSAITGGTAVTSTLTVSTTGPSSSALLPLRIFGFGGGGALAVFAFFALPFRRRAARAMLGAAILVAVGGAIGCGGSGGSTTRNAGTSAGSYTVTLTASNGSLNASTTVSVTVQ